jgi:hypothetical protein
LLGFKHLHSPFPRARARTRSSRTRSRRPSPPPPPPPPPPSTLEALVDSVSPPSPMGHASLKTKGAASLAQSPRFRVADRREPMRRRQATQALMGDGRPATQSLWEVTIGNAKQPYGRLPASDASPAGGVGVKEVATTR